MVGQSNFLSKSRRNLTTSGLLLKQCAVKAAGLSRPETGALHPMAIEVGCFSVPKITVLGDFLAVSRAAPVPLSGGNGLFSTPCVLFFSGPAQCSVFYLMGCEDGVEKTGVSSIRRIVQCHGQIKAVRATMKTHNQNLVRRVCLLSTKRIIRLPSELIKRKHSL
jgi:hypothetical protein